MTQTGSRRLSAVTLISSFLDCRAGFVSPSHPPIGTVGTLWNYANVMKRAPVLPHSQHATTAAAAGILPFTTWTATSLFSRVISGSPARSSASSWSGSNDRVRIAIVGGGIAGITAASAIAQRLPAAQIVVFEADSTCNRPYQTNEPPPWTAATARNANSIVPGASMHIMSQRSVLWQILQDTVREFSTHRFEQLRSVLNYGSSSVPLSSVDNFQVVPPYFALHLLHCMGPKIPWNERKSFFVFLRHFLVTSLLTGHRQAEERAKDMVQLAKANRHALLRDWEQHDLENKLGVSKGFLSLHRSLRSAQVAFEEARQFDEQAEMVPWERAQEMEPHLSHLPFAPLYAVHRPNDVTANCLKYVQSLKERCQQACVDFREDQSGIVTSIERLTDETIKVRTPLPVAAEPDGSLSRARFGITTADGHSHNSDFIVLAAGVQTPLLAQKLDAGHFCPTYPLRGYSMTVHANKKENTGSLNLLNRPISVDQMYCTSVGPDMARLAGFGELVGYRGAAAASVPSVAPRVMARYGRAIFPEADNAKPESAIACFRPLSPDDLPLAGKVGSVPGLFLHNGHGTLGWTLSLATAECVAQALHDDVHGVEDGLTFELPDKTTIPRSVLSPDRFA